MGLKDLARRLIGAMLGPVEPYRVLRLDLDTSATAPGGDEGLVELDAEALQRCGDTTLAEQAWYLGEHSRAFGWRRNGELAALCVYWWGPRYEQRNFWPLAEGQAKLVQIITAPAHRGHGIAGRLITASAQHMREAGFVRLYARVWHSNAPSLRAFQAAGWRRVATVVRCSPRWRKKPLRLRWGQRPEGASSPL